MRFPKTILSPLSQSRGSMILIVLITSIMALLVARAISSLLIEQSRSTKRTELHGERLDLRNFIIISLDCAATKTNATPSNSLVNLYDGQGRLFIKSDGSTQFGSYFMKGQVNDSGFLEVVVRNQAAKQWETLFPKVGTGCKIF